MTHDAEHWDALQALFHLGEGVPEPELDTVLIEASSDPELRARARALILEARTAAGRPVPVASLPAGRIGPYTLLRNLGSGGIGTVYLVERLAGGVVQRAALKVLSLHAAGPAFAERFAREQHILASLEHPNITRMMDAGLSDDGKPYLVMEYVDGQHLDVYCDDRALGIQARIKLFLDVCEAVAYAHRNLIVHLDLKPSNVLVTEAEGAVKLLDFGTSKLIEPDSLLTTTVMATPAYASPEQLRNEAVTTACDVYALGAILFELLAGRRPNQDSSVAVMIERSMKEFAPEPLAEAVTAASAERRGTTQARLAGLLRGDLATIVAKCLNPRPRDRYPSVESLVVDLDRYLAGRPVLARPQTTGYRLAKFVRRNRTAVLTASIAAVALLSVAGYAVWQREQAYQAGQRALQMQNFMTQLFRLANRNYTGKPAATVPEFLQLGVRVLPDFIPEGAARRGAQLSLAESMVSDDDFKGAAPNLEAVIAAAKAAGDGPIEAEAEAALGDVDATLGKVDEGLKLTASALALDRKRGVTPSMRVAIESTWAYVREEAGLKSDDTLRAYQAAVAEARASHLPGHQLATQLNYLGLSLQGRGRLQEAEALFRESLDIYRHEPYATCDEALVYRYLGHSRSQLQDYRGSVAMYRNAYDRLRQCSGDDSLETLAVQGYIANAMLKLGDPAPAVPLLEAALPRWRARVGPDSTEMATPLLFLTRAYLATGQFDKAEPTARELLRVLTGKMNARSSTMGVCQEAWAQALAGEHRYPEALEHAHAAVDAFPDTLNPGEKANLERAKTTLRTIEIEAGQASNAPRPVQPKK
jgi:serine/threonine-protein kinase